MSPTRAATAVVAIAGNPNVGKTSIFNHLTGADLKVSNYPGVTVERHEGRLALPNGETVTALDIPGTYSLSGRSAEEQIAINAIAGIPPLQSPDLVVAVVDATQLSRNLYLVLQILELSVPTVIALTMVDILENHGHVVDVEGLERVLGVPVVPVVGHKGRGIERLRERIAEVREHPERGRPGWRWHPEHPALLEDIDQVAHHVPAEWGSQDERRWALALWALLSLDEDDELQGIPDSLRVIVRSRRKQADREGREIEAEVIRGRYEWIDTKVTPLLRATRAASLTRTERADSVLLHPIWGFAIFLLFMGLVFQSLFSGADPAIRLIETSFGWLANTIEGWMPPSALRGFLVDGVIAGVGSVVVFLPQILLLFLLIGLMEDAGYMARVAFLMDRIMRRIGLHGRAFVPMMGGFACAVPSIMATRTMERRRDRMITMMVIPLMTCSARLPVYTLLIAALFPARKVAGIFPVQGLLMVAMYLFSTVIALVAAGVLGRFVFRGHQVPLLLELPPYRMPHWPSILKMMWQRAEIFLSEAGRVILLCTIALWALLSYPKLDVPRAADAISTGAAPVTTVAETAPQTPLPGTTPAPTGARAPSPGEADRALLHSYGARLGKLIEPVIEPLGFDWKIGIGLIGAFAAREVFISTMGVVYGLGDEVDESSVTLRERIRSEVRADGRPVYSPLVGLSLMVFIALSCQCMSTLAAVYRETKGWRWPMFLFSYMTVLAWVFSFAVYQGGRLLGLG